MTMASANKFSETFLFSGQDFLSLTKYIISEGTLLNEANVADHNAATNCDELCGERHFDAVIVDSCMHFC